ncbi:MAG: type I DNA topoisomerase [Planctomycetes bacterium]|nr:type I DNA topoisomerase [Planctomycetota bacterium]
MPKPKAKRKSLVIVESPAKCRTINKYLGPDFNVVASMGHVRDLPSKGINVDIENNFEPTYDITPGKKRTVISLKAAAKKCDTLYLATDLDREGEAIAWHLAEILGFDEDKTYRVIFNAITKQAITAAFAKPGKLDMDKVMAQQARRILDRIVGYQMSPLLWKKVARGLSAGRVQSVAVKMVVEREKEIRAFDPVEYWLIPAVFSTDTKTDYSKDWEKFISTKDEKDNPPTIIEQNKWLAERNAFKAEITKIDDKKYEASNKTQADKIFNALNDTEFKIADLQKKESSSRPSPPFITSTLQQAASNRLSFGAKRTMQTAQQLYEGIDLGSMGSLGMITYMRTDSTHISPEALVEARNFISNNFGPQYIPEKANVYTSKKSAQQAHEAIRPTDIDLTPDEIKSHLTDAQYKLYDLIWRRFTSSQMSAAKWDVTNVDVTAQTSIGTCHYRTTGRVLVFDGFTKVWYTTSNHPQLPEMQVGQQLQPVDISPQQHFTKPPSRFNEASLVKALEKEGIGRPSTYASIISTIQDRKYVEQEQRRFYATDLGIVVTDKLNEYFSKIMDVEFTRHMEDQLDKIEEQHLDWVSVLKEFYGPFKKTLDTALAEMKHAKAETSPSEYTCPDCNAEMVYRFGKNGRFLSCSLYPECKYACPCDRDGKMMEPKPSEHKCPNCKKDMIEKFGRFGKFLGCEGYPECKTIMSIDKDGNVLPPKPPPEPTGVKCYKCHKTKGGELVIRQSKRGPFMGCNKFPKCRTIISIKKLDELKEMQEKGIWPPETYELADEMLGRKKAKKTTKKTAKKTAKKTKA